MRPTQWQQPQQRYLVVSLLTKNPTSAADSESAQGVTTRARSRRAAVSVSFGLLPEEILVWEVFVRLPANDIIRCRAVCRSWHRLTSDADFLLRHHRCQPSRLLLTLCGTESSSLPTFERGLPILGFDDYNFELHASCDGLLLVSLSTDRCYSICNPATRQCTPVPGLANARHIDAMYLHHPSGEYRVLYRQYGNNAANYILAVPLGGASRCIGITITSPSSPDMDKVMMAWHEMTLDGLHSPIVFHNCLHWDPDWIDNDVGIVIFDTVLESFRSMRRPDPVSSAATGFCLCDMEGSIGFSCFDDDEKVAKIWVLQDYEREIWEFKYQVKFPFGNLCHHTVFKQHLVLTHEGYMLVYDEYELNMFQCDNTGKLLEEFGWIAPSSCTIDHWFKESLIKHDFFPRCGGARAGQPNLFSGL